MIEDNPDWQIYTRMLRALYQNHAARTSIAGTVESISHITAKTLYDCHKAFYTPANMILTVVGDVDPIHMADLANRVLPERSGSEDQRENGAEPEGGLQVRPGGGGGRIYARHHSGRYGQRYSAG